MVEEERWGTLTMTTTRRRKRGRGGAVMCSAGMEGIGGREVARSRRAVAIPERAKVVAMMAVVMLLCNADRVVMSVAVVPLAAKYGWSSSFLGIVQVRRLLISILSFFFFC